MENQRIRLSKKMMQNALIELLKEKDLYHITVKEICQKAEINRTTFYKYYSSPVDLMDHIIDNFNKKVDAFFCDTPDPKGKRLEKLLSYLMENKELSLLSIKLSSDSPKFSPIFAEVLKKDHPLSSDRAKYDYVNYFFSAGCSSLIRAWLMKEEPEPASYIVKMIFSLCQYQES